jgi:hypothetical protein
MSKKLHASSWDMRRVSEGERARIISETLKEAVDDQCLRGRLCVYLANVLRECDWLVKTIRGLELQEFTRDQVASQLACIDVNVRYLSYDIDGLRKSLVTLFATLSQGSGAPAASSLNSSVAHSSLFGQHAQSELIQAAIGSSIP